jgi:hypothetical protein
MQVVIPHVTGSAAIRTYHGKVDARILKSWAAGLIPDYVHILASDKDVDRFLQLCGATWSHKAKSRKPDATWRLCVVLPTDRPTPSATYRGLASEFKGQV